MKKLILFIVLLLAAFPLTQAQTVTVTALTDTFAIRALPDQPILKVVINTSDNTFTLNRLVVYSTSEDSLDISKVKLYRTSKHRFSKIDYPAEVETITATGVSLFKDSAVFSGLTFPLTAGVNIIWITYDLTSVSKSGHTIGGTIKNGGITISGSSPTFTTVTNNILIRQKYFIENFEKRDPVTFKPLNWTVNGDENAKWICFTGGYSSQPSTAKSGTYNARSYAENYEGRSSYLISPPLNLSLAEKPKLTFYHAQKYRTLTSRFDSVGVYYGYTTMGPWNWLKTYSVSTTDWVKRDIDLPDPMVSSKVYLVFKSTAQYGFGVCVDSLTIYEANVSARIVKSITSTHPKLNIVPQGSSDNPVLRFNIGIRGNTGILTFSSVTITSLNSLDTDIKNVRLYSSYDSVFVKPTLMGTGIFSGGKITFNGFTRKLDSGDNYFWITYDINSDATPDNFLDAKIAVGDIIISDGNTYPNLELSPDGSRQIKQSIFFDDFEEVKAWNLNGFERGTPQGKGAVSFGLKDPSYAYSKDNVIGIDLGLGASDGDYAKYTRYLATTPLIEARYFKNTLLNYARWLNAENKDSAVIEYQYDGQTQWNVLWSTSSTIIDGAWSFNSTATKTEFDRKNFKVRFRLGETNNLEEYSGWNIDDFFLTGDSIKFDAAITEFLGPFSACGLTNGEQIKVKVQNTGPKVLSNIPIKLSIDGGQTWINETIVGNFAVDAVTTHTFQPLDLSTAAIYNVIVKVAYPGDNYSDNDSVVYNLVSVPTYTVPYKDGLEIEPSFWLTSGVNSSWTNGIPGGVGFVGAYDGEKCWKTNYNSGYHSRYENSYVESPCFNLSDAEIPVIDFFTRYSTQLKDVGARLEYSINGGSTYNYLPKDGYAYPWTWYNDLVTTFHDGTKGFTGTSLKGTDISWLNGKQILPNDAANKSLVRFRFHFKADSSITATDPGFAFDDFKLFNSPHNAGVISIDNITTPACQYANPNKLQVSVQNFGLRKIRQNDSIIIGIKVNTKPVVIDTFKLTSDLAVGATRSFTMTKPAYFEDPGNYAIKAFVINKYPSYYGTNTDTTTLNITVYTNPITTLPDTISTARLDTLNISTLYDATYQYAWKYEGTAIAVPNTTNTLDVDALGKSFGKYTLKVNDANCTTHDTVFVKRLIRDVGVSAILSPTDDCGYKDPKAPEIRINNFGTDTLNAGETIPIKIKLNGDAELNDIITLSDKFVPGDAMETTLVKTLDLMTPQTNKLKIWTDLTLDDTTRNDTTNLSFVIKGYPKVFLGNDTTIKGKLTYELDAGSFTSYEWNDGSTNQKLIITKPGTYSVTVKDGNSCPNSDTIFVHMVIHDLKMEKLVAPLTSCMQTATTQIIGQVKNVGTDTIKTDEPIIISYKMNGGALQQTTINFHAELKPGDSLQHTFATTQNITTKGIYSFVLNATVAGDIQPANDELLQSIEIWGNPSINLGPDRIEQALSYNLYPGKFNKYEWQDASQDTSWLITKDKFEPSRVYSVTVTDNNGCTDRDTVALFLQVNDLEVSDLVFSKENCKMVVNMNITNVGNVTLTNRLVELSYTLDGVLERDTITFTGAVNKTYLHNFNIPYDLSVKKGDYLFKAALKMTGDVQPLNDTGTFITHIKEYPNVDFGDDTLVVELPYNLAVDPTYMYYKWQEEAFTQGKYEYPIFKEGYDINNPKYTVSVQDSNYCALPPVSVVVIGLHYDLEVTGISLPTTSCTFTPQKLGVVIKNSSTIDLKDQNLELEYSIDNGTVIKKNITMSILKGESKTVEFDETIDLPNAGNYNTIVTLTYQEDKVQENNSDTIPIIVLGNPTFSFPKDTVKTSALPYTINAGAGFKSYLWSNNSTDSIISADTEGLYRLTVTDNNDCVANDSVYIKLGTGFKDLESIGDIKLYPNPVSNYLNVEVNLDEKQDIILDIISTDGKAVYRRSLDRISEYKGDIDVSGLPKGLYYIRISTKEAVMSRKIVVK